MTTYIALVPGIIAFFYLFWAGEEKAFRHIYLPTLLLLPQIYSADLHGFPDLTTSAAAVIPIGVFTALKYVFWLRHGWRWSWMDFWVIIFIAVCCLSENLSTGDMPHEGNLTVALFASLLFDILFPYILGKALIHPKGKSVEYARKIAFLMAIAVLMSLYEMRFVANPFLEWPRFLFPGQGMEWPTLYRMGLVRVGGPFIQTILFGLGMAVGFVLNFWLTWGGKWGDNWRKAVRLPFSQGWIYGLILLFGILMTVSRGPVLAVASGMTLATLGFAAHRRIGLAWRLGILIIAATVGYGLFTSYSELSSTLTEDWTATAAYRARLWDRYERAIMEYPWLGWGFTTWPKDVSLQSIDNEYLFLVIKHGFIALTLFLGPVVWLMVRLLRRGLRLPSAQRDDISLCFTLLGTIATIITAILTVFLGLQLRPLFYILLGWSEGFLLSGGKKR